MHKKTINGMMLQVNSKWGSEDQSIINFTWHAVCCDNHVWTSDNGFILSNNFSASINPPNGPKGVYFKCFHLFTGRSCNLLVHTSVSQGSRQKNCFAHLTVPWYEWQCQTVQMQMVNTVKWRLMKSKSARWCLKITGMPYILMYQDC